MHVFEWVSNVHLNRKTLRSSVCMCVSLSTSLTLAFTIYTPYKRTVIIVSRFGAWNQCAKKRAHQTKDHKQQQQQQKHTTPHPSSSNAQMKQIKRQTHNVIKKEEEKERRKAKIRRRTKRERAIERKIKWWEMWGKCGNRAFRYNNNNNQIQSRK